MKALNAGAGLAFSCATVIVRWRTPQPCRDPLPSLAPSEESPMATTIARSVAQRIEGRDRLRSVPRGVGAGQAGWCQRAMAALGQGASAMRRDAPTTPKGLRMSTCGQWPSDAAVEVDCGACCALFVRLRVDGSSRHKTAQTKAPTAAVPMI